MLNSAQFWQIVIWMAAVFILLFVLVRVTRWHKFYYEARKDKCMAYNFPSTIRRQLYIKPVQWLSQRNHFFHIEHPIEVSDYSEGRSYYARRK